MRTFASTSLLLVAATAWGQTIDEQRYATLRAEAMRIYALEKRIEELRPQRRDGPIRPENIRDAEVRELQAIVAAYFPGAVVNIGPVVTACPCEDGATCTDQVWVLAQREDKSSGVLLSKIGNQWRIGPVQLWWQEYEKLRANDADYFATEKFKKQFPTCAAKQEAK